MMKVGKAVCVCFGKNNNYMLFFVKGFLNKDCNRENWKQIAKRKENLLVRLIMIVLLRLRGRGFGCCLM